jgi:hypothetical protein
MKFTRFLLMGAVMLALCFPQGGWATDATQKEAEAAAQPWLALVDGGKYPKSWDAAAEIFKKAMPTESWQKNSPCKPKASGQGSFAATEVGHLYQNLAQRPGRRICGHPVRYLL